MIRLQHISKSFGPVAALQDVSLDIPPRTILGLLGENGAGKSTLMHILFGLIRADAGTIRVADREEHITSPRDATRLGIGMVHQHFKLVPTLTPIENFSLFLRKRPATMRPFAAHWLERLRWSVPLEERVERLTVGQQQRVEIVKALLAIEQKHGTHFDHAFMPTLILDEPTAVLTPQETAELFAAVRTLRDAGLAVVFISHKLAEVQSVCDHIAILHRGKLVHTGPTVDLSPDAIADKMVGSRVEMPHLQIENQKPQTPPIAPSIKHPVLALTNISTAVLKSISLHLLPGEILGIAGVDGNGQSDLAQFILGIRPWHRRPADESTQRLASQKPAFQIHGQDAHATSTRDRLNQIAFIAEDRQREALILPLSIQENLVLKDYRKKQFNTLGWLRFRAWHSHARALMHQFDIRATSPRDAVANLSGGNQQKVVIARELQLPGKSIVLAVNPTRGLDVGATAFVLRQLLDARRRGAGILLIHSDLDELLAVSDRIAVLYNGTLIPTAWPDTTKETIGRLMLGLPPAEAA